MKKSISLIAAFIITLSPLFSQTGKKALLIIDIQNFYFPGGRSALVEPEKAAANAALLVNDFRNKKSLIVHVRHNADKGAEINDIVKPAAGEKIVSKDEVNCFLNNDLTDFFKSNKIDTLIICGMQTHMCVEAAVRAASDLGFKCILIHDACATRDLKFGEKTVRAEDVHNSTLATLRSYANITSTSDFLKSNR